MADDKKFIEENKQVLIEEMAENINKMNEILSAVLSAPIDSELDGSLMRTYMMAMGMQIGSLATLFNQYYVLLKGVIQRDERPTGFASLIKHVDTKIVSSPSLEPADPAEIEDDKEE